MSAKKRNVHPRHHKESPQVLHGHYPGADSTLEVFTRNTSPKRRPASKQRFPRATGFLVLRRRLGQFALVVAAAGIVLVLVSRVILPSAPPEIGTISLSLEPLDVKMPELPWKAGYELRHRIRQGESLAGIFSNYGLSVEDARQVHESLKSAEESGRFAKLQQGQELLLRLRTNGSFYTLHTAVDATTKVQVKRSSADSFVASVSQLQPREQERIVSGSIQSSFAQAASSSGLPYAAIDDFVDLFGDRISFHRDFRKGDAFSIIYRDSVLENGTSVGGGTILAAAIEVAGKAHYAVRYVGADGVARYFDEGGNLLGNAFLRYPLKFTRISSLFSKSRFHPVLKKNRPHNGVDFAAPIGTPIRSVADGTVEFAGRNGGSGIMLKIKHSDRYTTAYLHLRSIAKGIKRGSKVQRGQVIGAVGMTGLSTGPHLHYSLYDRGRYVDPLKAKLPTIENLNKGQRVDPVYLRRVLFTLEHYRGRNLEIAQLQSIT